MEKIKRSIKTKVHEEPRFSVNKLGEYLTATPARRKKLILDQKYPQTFITTYYKVAREAIIKFILNDYDESYLDDAIEVLEDSDDITDVERENSISLLSDIRRHELPNLAGYKIQRYSTKKAKIKIKGLDISVCPDLIIRKGKKVGCIKIHVIKTNKLTKDASQYVGTLLYKYVEDNVMSDDEVVDYKSVISIDCFADSYEIAPKSIKRRMDNIETGCEEIVGRWKSI